MVQWLKHLTQKHEDLGLDPRAQWHTFVILTLKGAGEAGRQAGSHSSLFSQSRPSVIPRFNEESPQAHMHTRYRYTHTLLYIHA